jgi:hypothetical protein
MNADNETQTNDLAPPVAHESSPEPATVPLPRWLRFWSGWNGEVERRSGRDRRLTASERFRQRSYGYFFGIEPHFADVDLHADPPVPVVQFNDDHRLEVLLSLHNCIRECIHQWENRTFQAFLLSEGALLSAVAFFLQNPILQKPLIAASAAIFGGVAWTYIFLAAKAHANNGILLVKIEAALGLCQKGTYIQDAPFFGYTGIWVPDWRTPILLLMHFATTVFAVCVLAFANAPSKNIAPSSRLDTAPSAAAENKAKSPGSAPRVTNAKARTPRPQSTSGAAK